MSAFYDQVFWAEAHDDVQQLNLSRDWKRKRIVTLFLVSNKVLFHPSYLWRSSSTHTIVFNRMKGLFVPDYTRIILGRAKSVEDYILTRIDSLSGSEYSVLELQKYNDNFRDIADNVPDLDALFSDKSSQYGATIGSRDNLFRRALAHELSFGSIHYLRRTIAVAVENATGEPCPQNLFDSLIEWVNTSAFVSHEALVLQIQKITGFPISYFESVKLHALNIYLSSTVGPDVQVPFERKFNHLFDSQSNHLFDPLDPNIFFYYLEILLGKKIYGHYFEDLDWNKLVKITIILKEEPLWLRARDLYLTNGASAITS
jgi:hypothetical protein